MDEEFALGIIGLTIYVVVLLAILYGVSVIFSTAGKVADNLNEDLEYLQNKKRKRRKEEEDQ